MEKGSWGIEELKDQKYNDIDNDRTIRIQFNSITKMEGFNGFSLEELRFIDYRNHFDKKIDLNEFIK